MPLDRDLLIGEKETRAASGRTTADISPWTGEPCVRVAAAGPEDVRAPVEAADAAFAEWAAFAPLARWEIFLRAADLMEQRGEQVVGLPACDVGGTRGRALFDIEVAAGVLREAAAAITAPRGDVLTAHEPDGLSLAVREPLGVVAAFAPWNAPVTLGTGRSPPRSRRGTPARPQLRHPHRERHSRAEGGTPHPHPHRARERPVGGGRTAGPLRRVRGLRLRPLRRTPGHRVLLEHPLGHTLHRATPPPPF